jgi:hypothetical protein
MELIKQNRGWAGLAVVSGLVCWAWIGFGGPLPPFPEKDRAAWVQAYGSVLAIVASATLAIWVPIHMRALAERDLVQRALNAMIVACGATKGTWLSLAHSAQNGEIHDHTGRVFGAHIELARGALNAVSLGVLLGASYEAYGAIAIKLRMVEYLLEYLVGKDGSKSDVQAQFRSSIADLEKVSAQLAAMAPRKIAGHWMIYSRDEGVPSGALDR